MPNPRTVDVVVCPSCKGPLVEEDSSLKCGPCGAFYPLHYGLPSFAEESGSLGEFSREEMRGIIDYARTEGWRAALDSLDGSGKEFVSDLILSERRANFQEFLELGEDDVVLDIGCGYGGVSLALAQKCSIVVALDAGLERVGFLNVIKSQEARDNVIAVHNTDMLNLPFADATFDVVTMIGVFEYLPLGLPDVSVAAAQQQILQEVQRILKPGGRFYLATKNRFGWQFLLGGADHNYLRFGPVLPRPLADVLTRTFYKKPYRIIVDSLPGYKSLLNRAGFTDSRFYWPVPSYQFPKNFMPLESGASKVFEAVSEGYRTGVRKYAIKVSEALGILRYIVPYFSIVAHKPESADG